MLTRQAHARVNQTKLFSHTNHVSFNLHFKSKSNFVTHSNPSPDQAQLVRCRVSWSGLVMTDERGNLKPSLSLCDAAVS